MSLIVTQQDLFDHGAHWRTISAMTACCLKRLMPGVYLLHRRCTEPLHRPGTRMIEPIDDDRLASLGSNTAHIRYAAGRALLIEAFTATRHGARLASNGAAVFSHGSAAHLHALPFAIDERPLVEVQRPGKSRQKGYTWLRPMQVGADQIVEVSGLRTTSPARTVLDIARTRGLDQGLPMAEAALRSGALTAEDLIVSRDSHPGRRLHVDDALLRLLSGRSESAGEALLKIRLDRAGLLGDLVEQYSVYDEHGFVARVDFAHSGTKLAIEFDGYGKYFLNDADGRAALKQERRREADLRAAGWEVIRVEWRDLFDPAAIRRLCARIARHLATRSAA